MRFSEIIAKLSGIDPAKEYNLQLDEIKENDSTDQSTDTTTTPPKNDNDEGKGADNNSSTVELESLKATIAEQNKAIAELKAANFALLSRTPAANEPSVEERILSIAGYTFKEDKNGNS